ncbi:hypothetical protein LTR08_005754 [Meristemomyces frigidus]|nr:hypothetical protein LTR08_005754 [Meristemomyces frigidus]
MQNPSHGVAQPLQNHVHLISGHRFPLVASLDLGQAVRYLLDGPQIVKQIAPMSWTYVQAPQDGTIWLEWLPPDKNERFPSDGYVWGDPEATYRQEFGGYTVEIVLHTTGFRPQYDHMASHARTRYHCVAKNPSVNAAPPDPSLWIVHYHQAEHNRILPSSQVPFTPQLRQVMSERQWLESQGALEKKDFMLHDRGSWPTIDIPRRANMAARQMQQPGFYGANVQQNRYPQFFPQPAGQPPQAKRQKMSIPVAGAAAEGAHDTSIEDEENTTLGDFFDHLTPRDISMTRYMQHHRWMEEVFSSPYASSQIVPTDLGLGLMGELKGLTEGILEPPSLDIAGDQPQGSRPKEAQPFTNLKREQIDEFDRRVEKHLEEGQAEIERMRVEHAAKMAEWKQSSKVMQAEKRLRYATWEGHESAMRLEEGQAEDGGEKETVDDVVEEVEGLLGVKIGVHKEAKIIEKGGLEKEEEAPKLQQQAVHEERIRMLAQQQPPQASTTSSAGSLPEVYHSDPLPPAIPASQMQQQRLSQQYSTMGQQQAGVDTSWIPMAGTSMMESVNTHPPFEFGAQKPEISAIHQAMAAINSKAQQQRSIDSTAAATTSQLGTLAQAAPSLPQHSLPPTDSLTSGAGNSANADSSMFEDNTFDDFTTMDEAGGDELVDFEGGGMGDDMFGDALHGMEDAGGDGGADGGQ